MIKDSLNKKSREQDKYERAHYEPLTPLSRPLFSYEEVEQVRQVLKSGWVSKGPKAREFETLVEEYLNVKHAIAVTNCTCALHLALLAFDIGFGDNVIVSDYTFPASGFAVRYTGASVLLCDVLPDTYNMNPKHFEYLCRKYSPKAVIVVHAFGQCADMDLINEIARMYDVKVIEDAACALGAKYKSDPAGSLGDVACFSLHARKGITTGEGGIVTTNDDAIALKIKKLSEFGVTSTWEREQNFFCLPVFENLGYNYKMSDITAGVGVAQMGKINDIIGSKRYAATQYGKIFDEAFPFLLPPVEGFGNYHVYQSYVTLVKPEYKHIRNWIIEQFLKNRVGCTIGTYALSRQPYFSSFSNACPVSDDLFDRAVSLPIYFRVGMKHIKEVGKKIAGMIDRKMKDMDNLKGRMPKKKENIYG